MVFELIIICTIGLVIAWQFVLYMYVQEVKNQNEGLEKTLDLMLERIKRIARKISDTPHSCQKNKSAAEGNSCAECKE